MGRLIMFVVGFNAALGIAGFLGMKYAIRKAFWGLMGKPDPEHNDV